jgi:hypothetical protein
MKKFMIAAILMIATTLSSFAGPIVTLKIEIGHGPDCIGWGICKATLGATWSMTAQIDDNTGAMTVVMPKSAVQDEVELLETGTFNMPADYSFPADVCAKLGVQSFTVKRGNYTIRESNLSYTIVFTPSQTSIR